MDKIQTLPAIELKSVTFAFPEISMRFDLNVEAGAMMIVTGPSGSGKSTLLNLIGGFEQAQSGAIRLIGMDVTNEAPQDRPVSFLFQDNNVFAHLTVEQNAGLGLRPSLKLTAIEREKVHIALKSCGLEGKETRLPSELSGGERQRVAFARVLLENRPILLLDEPFAALGPALRSEMMELLVKLHHQREMTILAVTHHPDEWQESANGFIFVDNGSVTATGTMTDFAANSDKALRDYLGIAAR